METGKNRRQTVSRSYEIDQAAQNVFRNWIPSRWIPREEKPDIFLDYTVETVSNGEPTGMRFAVQLKGCESTNVRKYSMKTKHLLYFLEQCQLPVFIFRIRPGSNEGYWIFAQQYVSEKLNLKVLRRRTTATIDFPPENTIANFPKFEQELERAHRFVRDLHPSSIEAAIAAERKKLEKLEPRLEFKVDVINGVKHIQLNPKPGEEFKFTLQIKRSPEVLNALTAHIEAGTDLKLGSESFEIIGTELFRPPNEAARIEFGLASSKKASGYAQLVSIKAGRPAVVRIDGICRGGTKRFSFDGEMPKGPLKLALDASYSNVLEKKAMTFNVGFSLSKWYGMELLTLPEFDQVFELYDAIEESHFIEIAFLVNGLRILNGRVTDFPESESSWILGALEWLSKAREICRQTGLNPKIRGPQDFASQHLNSVDEIYLHLQPNSHSSLKETWQLTSTAEMPYKEAVETIKTGITGKLRIAQPARTADFFGFPIPLGPVMREFSAAEVIRIFPVLDNQTGYEMRIPKNAEETVSIQKPLGPTFGN